MTSTASSSAPSASAGPSNSAATAASGQAPSPSTTSTTTNSAIPVINNAAATIAQGTSEVEIAPSSGTSDPKSIARFGTEKNPKEFSYIVTGLLYKGKKHSLTVFFPLDQPLSDMKQHEQIALQAEAERVAKLLIADLEEQPSINAEKGLNIVFNDNGYTAVPDDGTISSFEEVEKSEKAVHVKTDQAKALSEAMQQTNAEAIGKKLNDSRLETLRQSVYQKTARAAANANPVNLVNPSNVCYVNTAFHHLADDPALADELNNPDAYQDGAENPVYRAIQAYRAHQVSGNGGKFNAMKYVPKLSPDVQSDFMEAWDYFREQFQGLASNSRLNRALNSLQGRQANTFNDMLNAAWNSKNSNEQPPDVLTLQMADRIRDADSVDNLANLDDKYKRSFCNALVEQALTDNEVRACNNFFKDNQNLLELIGTRKGYEDAYNQAEKKNTVLLSALEKTHYFTKLINTFKNSPDIQDTLYSLLLPEINEDQEEEASQLEQQRIPIANAIFANRDALGIVLAEILPRDSISKEGKDAIAAIHSLRRTVIERNVRPIGIDESGVVTLTLSASGVQKPYTIRSFTIHQGSQWGGHFVHYFRKGNACYVLNDKNNTADAQEVSLEDFTKIAQRAYFYTLHAEGLVPATATTPGKSEKQSKQAVEEFIAEKGKEPIGDYSSTIEIGYGSLKAKGKNNELYTCVNPVIVGRDLNKQIIEALPEDSIRTLRTDFIFQKTLKSGFKPRTWYSGPGIETSNMHGLPLINIPINPLQDRNAVKQAVTDVLEYARKNKIYHLAFLVFECVALSEEEVIAAMRDAINAFDWQAHYRIVLPKPSASPTVNHHSSSTTTTPSVKTSSSTTPPQDIPLTVNGKQVTIQSSSDPKKSETTFTPAPEAIELEKATDLQNLTLDLTKKQPKLFDLRGSTLKLDCAGYFRDDKDSISYDKLINHIQKTQKKCSSITVICFPNEVDKLRQALSNPAPSPAKASTPPSSIDAVD